MHISVQHSIGHNRVEEERGEATPGKLNLSACLISLLGYALCLWRCRLLTSRQTPARRACRILCDMRMPSSALCAVMLRAEAGLDAQRYSK